MLKRFSAKQYKNVEADGLEFARVTVLVGPNNGGKSNFIEALRFYSDVRNYEGEGSAFLGVIERRGYGEVLRRSVKPPSTIELCWEHAAPQPDAKDSPDCIVEIAFQVGRSEQFPTGFYVTRDSNTALDGVTTPTSTLNEGKTELSQFSMGFAEEWTKLLGQRFFIGSSLDPRQIAASAKRNLTILHLNESGSELVNVLNNLERKHNDFLIPYENKLREALSGLERIRIDDVSDQFKSLKLRIDGDWFRLDELSEGTLKMMALALLLFTPEKSSLLSIDEPELNLHPAWLHVLGRWMLGATGADQVIASTHSPELLDALTEGFKTGEVALIVCDAKKGFRNVRVADLDSFFKEGWELGDLYRAGEPQLGGWPW